MKLVAAVAVASDLKCAKDKTRRLGQTTKESKNVAKL